MITEKMLKTKLTYYFTIAGFLVSLGLLLLTIVDIRRGFLFSAYFKVGAPSVLLNLNQYQLLLLLMGGLGVGLAYRGMTKLEPRLARREIDLKTLVNIVAIVIGVFLVIDLFIYRGVPASRIVAAGRMGAGPGTMGLAWAIPIARFPDWLQPLGEGLNYLLVVWHATTLGMLLGGLFLVSGASLMMKLKGNGPGAHLAGAALALSQPFCSCCAAPVGSALYRRGASLGAMLAFTVSSPMLNITTLILAVTLLPVKFALLRIAGGIIIGLFLTYGVSLLTARRIGGGETNPEHGKLFQWSAKVVDVYSRLFHFAIPEKAVDSPTVLISSWLGMVGKLAKVVLPVLLLGSVLAVYIIQLMPDSGNNILGVTVTGFFATLLMIPTWTEIPLAVGLINDGFNGIAATVLLTLPAVSLPCLVIIAGAVRSLRVVFVLGLAILITGIIAGIVFL